MTRILVIEDDPTVQTLIQKLLHSEGFAVLSASDGYQGIEIARTEVPDLIISDIMMPECDGYQVLETLHQSSDTANIPFIFLSAKSDKVDLRQGMEMGADDYLTKPFTRAELLGAIAARLAKQRAITQPYLDEMKRAADSLSQLAYRDPLTGLSNRILLYQQLQEHLRLSKQTGQMVTMMYLNIDRFRTINDTLGFSMGDQVLQAIAERLRQYFGEEPVLARLGADEFSIVLTNCQNRQDITQIAEALVAQLIQPYDLDGHSILIQPRIGIASYPEDGETTDHLLQHSEMAMRVSKRQDDCSFQFYDAEMDARMSERRSLESHLNHALDQDELQLYYQPQVNLITGRIIGVEVLLRWNHSHLGLILPDRFIPLAEENGSIISIGKWVLQTTCIQAQTWQHEKSVPIRVAVNLSARQFKQPNLIASVHQVLQETGLPPELLTLEITETSVMEDVDLTVNILQEFRNMGINISIDDFGTGYSSLNYLKRFPLDSLKIDQSFVQDISSDPNAAAIVKAIIAMAHSMQLKVIAEGVETHEQINLLRQSGCYSIQGYVFSPPVPAGEFEQMLLSDRRLQQGPF
jgi:diguanylate cyclase (GGDEF)-like protein